VTVMLMKPVLSELLHSSVKTRSRWFPVIAVDHCNIRNPSSVMNKLTAVSR